MKAISRKLTIGAGRPSGSWLTLLLLLAVLAPSACLLWFMNQAAHNERLAVRQKLADAYRVNLSLVQGQLEYLLAPNGATLDAEADRFSPPALFARQVRAGLADAVICFDATATWSIRARACSPAGSARGPVDGGGQPGSEQSGEAAAAFARLAAQATNAEPGGARLAGAGALPGQGGQDTTRRLRC